MPQGVSVMLIKRHSKQSGFALIDVMIAAVVLAVGVIAFLKLQNISLQRSAQTNYRLQASGAAETLIELMRGNRHLVGWATDPAGAKGAFIVQDKATVETAVAGLLCDIKDDADASVDPGKATVLDPTKWCPVKSADLKKELLTYVALALSKNFKYIEGKAVMCVKAKSIETAELMSVRVAVIWKNATSNVSYTSATLADCPKTYDEAVTVEGEDTQTPDRGFIEVFTQI